MSLEQLPSADKLTAFCLRHHIKRMGLFGSAIREDFGPDSDIDVLVEFEPGKVPGFNFFSIQEELSRLFGRTINLNTPGSLSDYFRDQVISETQLLYDAA